MFKRAFLLAVLQYVVCSAFAQEQPIGYWNSLFSYRDGVGVATDGTTLYHISGQSFFTFSTRPPYDLNPYSKVNGMSDVGMQAITYDEETKTSVLVYTNGNIDLFVDNTFYNIPDLKIKTLAGDKKIYQVYTHNGRAYLSTSLGVIVIDLKKKTIQDTYQFIVAGQYAAVTGFVADDNWFYALSENYLYRADKNSPQLQNFQIWTRIDSTHTFKSLIGENNKVIASDGKSVYELTPDSMKAMYTGVNPILNINPGIDQLFIVEYNNYKSVIKTLAMDYAVKDTFLIYDITHQVVELDDKTVWMSNEFAGLTKIEKDRTVGFYLPEGPSDVSSFDITARNGRVYVAHGGYDDNYRSLNNGNGFSEYKDGKWTNRRKDIYFSYQPFGDTMTDFVSIARDWKNDIVYAASFNSGLFELHGDNTYKLYNEGVIDRSIPNRNFPCVGLGIDANSNLWMTTFGAYHELYVKEYTTGNWYKYHLEYGRSYPYPGGPLTFDQAGNVWYVNLFGNGVTGYSHNNTLDDSTDDRFYHLGTGSGSGNLPDITVRCIAIDKNDNLWIGTANGIGILYNASSAISRQSQVEIPIVQYDKYAGYLFAGEVVRTIAVDGANRKWVGTNNGVWLLSPDAGNSKIISRFTTENSPLPSNKIQKIAIDPITGDVYIGTESGLIAYRGTATDAEESKSSALTFPNPVPVGYKGTIAIRGLPENADVKITDMSGQLIYKTTALGGQAVWNGYDYKGRRPQAGVYLIFASNADGTQTFAGKMVFLQ